MMLKLWTCWPLFTITNVTWPDGIVDWVRSKRYSNIPTVTVVWADADRAVVVGGGVVVVAVVVVVGGVSA